MLKIQFKDKRQEPFWAMEKALSIGHAKTNHLTIEDPSVSASHAKIINQGDTFLLKDLGSERGTFVNKQRITQKQVVCGDIISIGEVDLEIIDPIVVDSGAKQRYWSLIADSSWLSGQEFPIVAGADKVITLGRGSHCDIVFPGTHLSRQHAEITVHYSHLTLRDLGSANGTFVNDKKVSLGQIFPGDRIRLDVYSFRVFGPDIKLPLASTGIHRVIKKEAAADKAPIQKQWKSKPTSPGNREELNLYANEHKPVLLAGIVIASLIGLTTYIILGLGI